MSPARRRAFAMVLFFAAAAGGLLLFASGGEARAPRNVHHDRSAPAGLLAPVPRAGPAPAGAQSVIEPDERIRIADTTGIPFRAVVYLELYDANWDQLGTCTGTLIGPDAVLTAGHCLWNSATRDWTTHIRVVPGKDEEYEPFGSEYGSDWWVPDAYIESGGQTIYDWGVIALPSADLSALTGWLKVGLVSTQTLQRPDFSPAIVGYPGDKSGGTMWGHAVDGFAGVTDYRLLYDIDTYPGQSGSAIWSLNFSAYFLGYVVGIHTTGTGSGLYNSGSRVDQELLDDLLEGCRQMSCTIAYDVEVFDPPSPTVTPVAPSASPTRTNTPTPAPSPTPAPRGTSLAYLPAISRD